MSFVFYIEHQHIQFLHHYEHTQQYHNFLSFPADIFQFVNTSDVNQQQLRSFCNRHSLTLLSDEQAKCISIQKSETFQDAFFQQKHVVESTLTIQRDNIKNTTIKVNMHFFDDDFSVKFGQKKHIDFMIRVLNNFLQHEKNFLSNPKPHIESSNLFEQDLSCYQFDKQLLQQQIENKGSLIEFAQCQIFPLENLDNIHITIKNNFNDIRVLMYFQEKHYVFDKAIDYICFQHQKNVDEHWHLYHLHCTNSFHSTHLSLNLQHKDEMHYPDSYLLSNIDFYSINHKIPALYIHNKPDREQFSSHFLVSCDENCFEDVITNIVMDHNMATAGLDNIVSFQNGSVLEKTMSHHNVFKPENFQSCSPDGAILATYILNTMDFKNIAETFFENNSLYPISDASLSMLKMNHQFYQTIENKTCFLKNIHYIFHNVIEHWTSIDNVEAFIIAIRDQLEEHGYRTHSF